MILSPLVTIITVNYNNKSPLKRTINSVLSLNFNSFEYIIIDGDSNDGSVELIEKFMPAFKKKGIHFSWTSEKDKGIYDAMNKGISLSRGSWLNFMNAGDVFYSSNVLNKVFKNSIELTDKVLVYGFKHQNNRPYYPLNLEVLEKGLIMGNHQSMFFNKIILGKDLYYDLRYSIYADYELVNKIYLRYRKKKFKYINLPVAVYEGGGISEKVSFLKRKDKYLIILRHYGLIGLLKGLWYRIF